MHLSFLAAAEPGMGALETTISTGVVLLFMSCLYAWAWVRRKEPVRSEVAYWGRYSFRVSLIFGVPLLIIMAASFIVNLVILITPG